MCGFAGIIGLRGLDRDALQRTLDSMGNAIAHRGPDDSGTWTDLDAGVAFVHRRLSIVDLSPAGHQPMVSASGRYVIAFNGEIYNHTALRRDLENQLTTMSWRGHSDTETLLAAIEQWGLASTLKRSVGMFAMALWDKVERCLYLTRDRLGEKPLYYGLQNGAFLFGSELKAFKRHPSFEGSIDRNAIALQLRHNYIPAPYSIYKGIHKLTPGATLQIPVADGQACLMHRPVPYWSVQAAVQAGKRTPFTGDDSSAIGMLDKLLCDAVGLQSLADVPLGAFLSGGIDSSTIVALMQAQTTKPVKTFTIGFNEAGYNEAVHAKAIARHLGTEHTELYVSPEQALEVIPKLPAMYDEPFSDSSQIPTYLVSHMTRQHVTVSLSGDGGDELFAGYTRYFGTQRWWRAIQAMPLSLRRSVSHTLLMLEPASWNRIGRALSCVSHRQGHWLDLGNKVTKLAGVLSVDSSSALYRHFVTHWADPGAVVLGGLEPPTQVSHPAFQLDAIVEQMMALDTLSYLPDDILTKVDRAAMAVSLETRVPFLDHRVLEFAWQLPMHLKIRNGQGKWILRQVLKKYVPSAMLDRPKTGFRVPLDTWLRGPLRDWAHNLLDEHRLRQEGLLRPEPIQAMWKSHLSGHRNWQYHLWDILMFQAWLESV